MNKNLKKVLAVAFSQSLLLSPLAMATDPGPEKVIRGTFDYNGSPQFRMLKDMYKAVAQQKNVQIEQYIIDMAVSKLWANMHDSAAALYSDPTFGDSAARILEAMSSIKRGDAGFLSLADEELTAELLDAIEDYAHLFEEHFDSQNSSKNALKLFSYCYAYVCNNSRLRYDLRSVLFKYYSGDLLDFFSINKDFGECSKKLLPEIIKCEFKSYLKEDKDHNAPMPKCIINFTCDNWTKMLLHRGLLHPTKCFARKRDVIRVIKDKLGRNFISTCPNSYPSNYDLCEFIGKIWLEIYHSCIINFCRDNDDKLDELTVEYIKELYGPLEGEDQSIERYKKFYSDEHHLETYYFSGERDTVWDNRKQDMKSILYTANESLVMKNCFKIYFVKPKYVIISVYNPVSHEENVYHISSSCMQRSNLYDFTDDFLIKDLLVRFPIECMVFSPECEFLRAKKMSQTPSLVAPERDVCGYKVDRYGNFVRDKKGKFIKDEK